MSKLLIVLLTWMSHWLFMIKWCELKVTEFMRMPIPLEQQYAQQTIIRKNQNSLLWNNEPVNRSARFLASSINMGNSSLFR